MSTRKLLPDGIPRDPIWRINWLKAVHQAVEEELRAAYQEAYFDARLQGLLNDAVDAAPHSRKKVLAMTRAENEKRGRTVRWRDGADPTSSAYDG